MERELAQAQKMKAIGQLAAGIAHEINTPTQYIGDNARFLQDAFADIGGLLDAYDRLLQAAQNGRRHRRTARRSGSETPQRRPRLPHGAKSPRPSSNRWKAWSTWPASSAP